MPPDPSARDDLVPADLEPEPDTAPVISDVDGGPGSSGLHLSPRTSADTMPGRRGKGLAAIALLVGVVFAGLFVMRNLASATSFYLNADEAVARKTTQGTDRFKLQGSVVCQSVQPADDGVTFAVAFNGATVPVHSVGTPPQLFQEGIPVLLDGAWSADGARFESDNIAVKHSEEYVEKNNDRLAEAGSPDDVKLKEGVESAQLCGAPKTS